jgi:hypothetical protein
MSPDLVWLQVGSIGAGGILVVMVLDRVARLVSLVVKSRNFRKNGNPAGMTGATPAWRVSELLAEILGTLKQMRADLVRLHDQIAAMNGRANK